MSTRVHTFDVRDLDGAPLTGLALAFDSEGSAYLVNGSTPATLPAIAEEAGIPGRYVFTVTLAPGERLSARLALPAESLYSDEAVVYEEAEIRAPATAAEIAALVPTAEDIATEVADTLSAAHGSGAWGGAGGDGSQAVVLTVTDGTGPLSGARVEAHDGARVVATGRTDTDGKVTLLLDPGTYSIRCTLAGYSFSATDVVVSAPDTVTPDTLVGAALPAETTDVVGLTRTLSLGLGVAPDASGVSGVVAGDTVPLVRTFTDCPAAIAKVVSTWKRSPDTLGADADTLVLQKTWTVTDAGSSGTGAATLTLSPAETLAIARGEATQYDVQVELDDEESTIRTRERGTWSAVDGVTSDA